MRGELYGQSCWNEVQVSFVKERESLIVRQEGEGTERVQGKETVSLWLDKGDKWV